MGSGLDFYFCTLQLLQRDFCPGTGFCVDERLLLGGFIGKDLIYRAILCRKTLS
ncbi:hypothetical protein SAMN05421770_1028 [Granulicella rosea]|uniref:Uncharacterized protein n=1 Tax=Granulicella rosea TaxID=474952 RepID=A0A239GMV0_9BACT|nr:hypothetical protein SAMN05421770_1028 [Granulicella rosea]